MQTTESRFRVSDVPTRICKALRPKSKLALWALVPRIMGGFKRASRDKGRTKVLEISSSSPLQSTSPSPFNLTSYDFALYGF